MKMRAVIERLENGSKLMIGPLKTIDKESLFGGAARHDDYDFGAPFVFASEQNGPGEELSGVRSICIDQAADGENAVAEFRIGRGFGKRRERIMKWDDLHDLAQSLANSVYEKENA